MKKFAKSSAVKEAAGGGGGGQRRELNVLKSDRVLEEAVNLVVEV